MKFWDQVNERDVVMTQASKTNYVHETSSTKGALEHRSNMQLFRVMLG